MEHSSANEGGTSMLTKLTEFFSRNYPDQAEAVYLVGGYVRDRILSRSGTDLDLAVSGNPQEIAAELARVLGGSLVPLSPAHGVYRVAARGPEGDSWTIDLAGFAGSIEEDLARRDFTINAVAVPLSRWNTDGWREYLIDPFNGLADMAGKRVRATGPHVFQDDPGRLLRAVRLAAQLGFMLEPETARLIRADAPAIHRVAPERVRDEFLSILAGDGVRGQLEALDRLDLLCRVIPELSLTKGVEQPRVHYWDVWGHLIHAVESAERITGGHQNSAIYSVVPWNPDLEARFEEEVSDGHTRRTILKLTALLHDIAKPQTKAVDNTGRTRFLGHSEMGAEMATHRLGQLRLSSRGIGMVAKMVEQHLRPGNMRQGVEWPTQRAVYRYFRDLGDVAIDNLFLAMADFLAAKGPELDSLAWHNHVKMIGHIMYTGTQQETAQKPARLVSGHDLMEELGLAPGPQLGALLELVEEARAAGEITNREEALSLVSEALNRQG